MDFIIYLKAALLGVIEGATEFLPISSTGHLIIAGELLGFTGEFSKTFKIFIQLGAILAIVWFYRRRLTAVARNANRDATAQRLLINIAIAFLPAMVLGLMFHSFIKTYLFNPLTVASALIAGGVVILIIEGRKREPRITNVEDMGWRDALKVGLAQSLALFPGVSRAGATIMGGLVFGLSRQAATEFSFFLAIPTMFAATLYDLSRNLQFLNNGSDLLVLATGFVFAFLSALAVVKALLHYVARHDFKIFAYYRIIFGIIVWTLAGTGIVEFSGH